MNEMTHQTLTLFSAPSVENNRVKVNDDPLIYIDIGPPRVASIPDDDIRAMFHKTTRDLGAFNSEIETLCGLRKGTARDWYRRRQIPPPMIVALFAHLNSFEHKHSILQVALAMAQSPNPTAHDAAKFFFQELRK